MPPESPSNKPEKLDLPEAPTGPSAPGTEQPAPHPTVPFSLELEALKSGALQQVNQNYQNLRKGNIKQIQELRKSKIVVYYSTTLLDFQDFQQFYDIMSMVGKVPRLDLFILSPGGFAGPAFKMARLCQELATEQFSVLIPSYAKSAATILSLGADEIVMGPASELGPIDPQIQSTGPDKTTVPALALQEALEFITSQVTANPRLAALYVPLLDKVDLMTLGHFGREIESAKQYAIQLLGSRKVNPCNATDAAQIAGDLVKKYKTHGFVIDAKDAQQLLGACIKILTSTDPVWQCMWRLHTTYDSYLRDRGYAFKIIETADATFERGIGGQKR